MNIFGDILIMRSRFKEVNTFHVYMTSDDENSIADFIKRKTVNVGYDKDENPVFLSPSPFLLTQAEADYPAITFHKTSEFKLDE